MVLKTRRESINRQIVDVGKICKAIVLGIVCVLTPVIIVIIDPIHTIVNYNLRLGTGSSLYNILQNGFKGAQLSVYMFNITNADRFLEGDDQKLRVEEIGPFVFQEFHWYENLQLSEDGKTMAMTPKYSSEFLPEKSIAHPRDINLTLPNLPMLSAATLLAPFPSFIRYMYSTMASQMNAKAIINVDVHKYLWGYKDPLITLLHKLVPGVVYFDTIGLLDRFYDKESEYRMVVGATKQDRFQIKTVTKFRSLRDQGIDDIEVSEQNFTNMNTYEGVGYPPELTPDTPINWYRLGVCKIFELEYKGTKVMDYGGEGQVYDISNSSFASERDPTATKVYANGLMDVSTCYYGLPYVASKAHFMDADPKLLDAIDGLKPDKELHKNEIIIDRRVGITFHTQATLQLNLVLEDITYNREARRLANTVVPIVRLRVDQLKMSSGKLIIFYLVYLIGPYTLMVIEALLVIIGLLLLAYAVRSMYFNWIFGNQKILQSVIEKKRLSEMHSGVPLIITDK